MTVPLLLHSLGGLRGVQLLAILVVANPWGRSTVAAADAGADTRHICQYMTNRGFWKAG